MKRFTILTLFSLLLLSACGSRREDLRQRAAELCRYLPDQELREESRGFMTSDFYAVLDTLFHHLPDHEAMDHEWLHYFVTANGGTIADYEVTSVQTLDETHGVATLRVRQKWEDGSFDPDSDVEDHQLYMERVDGLWLMSDFDLHKQHCIDHIRRNCQEQARREAICSYLESVVGADYLTGDFCVPVLLIAAEEGEPLPTRVWCDCWVFWYNAVGDTLQMVSGGNHSGCMTLSYPQGQPVVTAFEQTVDGAGNAESARRIFGEHYPIFHNIHSNPEVMVAARREQLSYYMRSHRLPFRFFKDHGRAAVPLD